MTELMNQAQAAKFLGVHPNTIGNWLKSGELQGYPVSKRNGRPGWFRFSPENLAAFVQQRETEHRTEMTRKCPMCGKLTDPQPIYNDGLERQSFICDNPLCEVSSYGIIWRSADAMDFERSRADG